MFFLEDLLTGLFFLMVITQVIIPAIRNRPMFPLFTRKKRDHLDEALQHKHEAEERLRVAEAEKEASTIEAKAKKVAEEAFEERVQHDWKDHL